MSNIISCPQCERKLRVPQELLGQAVKCPSCGANFLSNVELGENESIYPVLPPEHTGAFSERPSVGPAERWQASGDEGEEGRSGADSDDFYARKRRLVSDAELDQYMRQRRVLDQNPLEGLSNEYSIDIGQWFGYAKDHYSEVLGPMIGYAFIYIAILAFLSCIPFGLGGFARLFLEPPLLAGFTIVALAQLRRKSWTFGDFFSGFERYGSLLGNSILSGLIFVGCMLPAIAFWIALAIIDDKTGNLEPSLVIAGFAILVLDLVVTAYVVVRATCFNVALIVDRGCGCIEAIQGSWRLSSGHFWGVLGCWLLTGLIGASGLFLCGIGALFTFPFASLVWNAGYLLITRQVLPQDNIPVSRTRGGLDYDRI